MSDCFKKNDLLMPGTRQDERLQNALDPSYVLADERSVADILAFISKYATLINYYALKTTDQSNYIIDGDWKPLIISDEAFNYAGISVTPYSLPNITFYKYVNLYETGSTDAKRKDAYRVLWDILFSLYKNINSFYTALPVTMSLRNEIAIEINNALRNDFGIAANAYLNDAVAIPSLDLQVATSSADDDYKFEFANNIIHAAFDKIWIDKTLEPTATTWTDYITKLTAETALAKSFFNTDTIASDFDRIDYSTLQLKQIFKHTFEAYARIIAKANDYLQNSLQSNSAHYAHHGLMLAFLKLFDVVRLDINGFTRKHLEYYYSRVLQIDPAPAVPDAAHIVFEPAKNITTHLVEKDTPLNAGKDGLGKLMLYNTDEEIVINQTKVEQVKTLFVKPKSDAGDIEKIYASPMANSPDGNGAAFTNDDHSWKGFGNDLNVANLGFYIASPVLHLTEGNRYIKFVFTTNADGKDKINNLTDEDRSKLFSFSFSGEKQWEPLIIQEAGVTDFNSTLNFVPASANPDGTFSFTIEITLLPQCKPVVGYDALKCEGNLNTLYPVMKFVLNQDSWGIGNYRNLKNIIINKISINIHVWDITGLSLQNDLGTVDASKPVQAFGPNPQVNSTFYIGHPELEHKQITNFFITLNWLNLNSHLENYYSYTYTKLNNGTKTYVTESYVPGITSNDSFKIKIDFIRNKTWQPSSTFENSLFASPPITVSFSNPINAALVKPDVYKPGIITYTTTTQNGFIRLKLSKPADAFGHSLWPKLFAQQTVAITSDPDITHNTIPNPPYTPLLESIKLYYVAIQEIDLDDKYKIDQGQFFHLTAFGIKELTNNVTLLPSFQSSIKQTDGFFTDKEIESALIIGISNAQINQNISLLLQMNEGSEDISVDAPTIIWNYLSANGWKNFDKLLLADSTDNLVKSGIIKFQVPVDININSTELSPGFMWISASIEPDLSAIPKMSSDGLPKLLAVYSNAVKATFINNANDPEHLAKPIPADKIAKLYESDVAVKKISQPYPSFGGKKTEQGNKFYTRVSERLRHKHRAITIWDYERLVLNEFPEVYMVKCLNHTGYEIDCSKAESDPSRKNYKENLPGNVMLVTIPFVTNLQSGNIFQPALSAAVLDDITKFIHGADNADTCNKYIKALHCGLAVLKVENPKYETIKVTCKIKVKQCFDQLFYQDQLSKDLNNFLSPWITGNTAKINFGGKLHVSQVIYFVEQLSYIDYVTNVTIEHADESGILNLSDPSIAVTTTSKSVLTSFGTHNIQPV